MTAEEATIEALQARVAELEAWKQQAETGMDEEASRG